MKLAAIGLTGSVEPWLALGFAVDDAGRLCFANGALAFGREAPGLVVEAPELVRVPDAFEAITLERGVVPSPVRHGNGAIELDHVVVMTPSLERTSAAITEALGLEQRRVRETPSVRQAFHRFDDHDGARGCIVEVVENERVGVPGIWGVVVIVDDLETAVAAAPDLIGRPKDAVQPGRRIATVSRAAGLSTAVALMSR